MRVAFVITGLGVGGAERVVTSLADALFSRGHKVLIVYLTGEALLQPINSAIQVIGLGVNSMGSMMLAFVRLRAILTEFRPDVVHSHLVHANIFTRLLRLWVRIPYLISTAHSNNEGGWFRMLAYRLTDTLANISTNVSRDATASFIAKKAVGQDRMITVYNGIAVEKFQFSEAARLAIRQELGITAECKLILAVGRLWEPKDYPNLLGAISYIATQRVDFKVCIVGEGPLRSDLVSKVQELKLVNQVQFLGMRSDVEKLLSAADVFVLSSIFEGFPMAVGEAMACERVVVATDCGGVREFLGSTGYLVPPADSIALANTLVTALTLSPERSAAIGQAARLRVQDLYSLNAAVDRWLALYAGNHLNP